MISIVVDHTHATAQEEAAFKKSSPIMDFISKSRILGFTVDLKIIKNDLSYISKNKLNDAAICAVELLQESNLTAASMKAALNDLTQDDIQSAKNILSPLITSNLTNNERGQYLINQGWKPINIL